MMAKLGPRLQFPKVLLCFTTTVACFNAYEFPCFHYKTQMSPREAVPEGQSSVPGLVVIVFGKGGERIFPLATQHKAWG